jgi:hypothetical protein
MTFIFLPLAARELGGNPGHKKGGEGGEEEERRRKNIEWSDPKIPLHELCGRAKQILQ